MQGKLIFVILLFLAFFSGCQGKEASTVPKEQSTPSLTKEPQVSPSEDKTTPTTTPTQDLPGILPEVDSLPKADTSLVGTQCTLRLMETEDQCFAYYYDKKSGRERLVTLPIPPSKENRIPVCGPLTVYETRLGGVNGLREALNTETEATVLAVVNVSFQELMAAWYGVLCQYEETENIKQLVLSSDSEALGDLGRFFGGNVDVPSDLDEEVCQPLSNGQYVILWEVLEEGNNNSTSDMDAIFRKIYERYALTELVLGNTGM